jgi:hypothetical protein
MYKPSEETREKMRKARLGKKFIGGWKLSEETKQKMRQNKKGYTPWKAIEKAKVANRGIKRSKESL